jgi:hypothetical protein
MNQNEWDQLSEERNKAILIGRCENQALELLKEDNWESQFVKDQYKDAVKMLFKLNTEVEADINNLSQKKQPIQIKEPNQKQCPKCKVMLPLSWKYHEACGWKE